MLKTLVIGEQLRRKVPGGIGTYVRGLVEGLVDRPDVEATIWASRSPRFGSDPLRVLGAPVTTSRWPSRLLTRAWDNGRQPPPEGFDVVHATSLVTPPKSKMPMTVMVADVAWRAFPAAYPERGRRWHEAALARAIEHADLLFTPSSATANDLINDGVPHRRIEVVSLGCDHLPQPDVAAVERRLRKLGVQKPFLLAVGTMEPRKNLAGLIEAYARARGKFATDVDLVIVGPVGWGETVKPVDGVKLVPSATSAEVCGFYEKCLAFVSVPFLEGFGLPVLEAMAMGAPVISSGVPSAGDATYLVDPHNVPAISEALLRVVQDDRVRADLVARGAEHSKSFTWANTARLHVRAWEAL